jgi:pimeloyl-ACP methyl ester carboxylesterase
MRMPGRVRRLALISPAATFHSIVPFYTHIFLPKAAYLFFPWLPGIEWTMRRSVDWAFAGLPSNGPWEELFYRAMLYGTTQTRVMPRVFTHEELARIEAPTLLLVGEQERIYRPEKAASAARRLMPSVQVGLIPRAHHVAAIANPDAVNAWLTAFLGDQPDTVESAQGC